MKINLAIDAEHYGTLTIQREEGDAYASNESVLLYWVKQQMNVRGLDLIKKRMAKDGHMMDDHQQYLRSRNKKLYPGFQIYNGRWALEGIHEPFNKFERVSLIVQPHLTTRPKSPIDKLLDDWRVPCHT